MSVGTTIAWGRTLPGLTDMHEVYLETYDLTQERFRFGHRSLIVKEWLPAAPGELYHLPVSQERQIAQAILKGDAAVILEVLRSAVVKLRELPYFECKMSLITLFMDIRRLIQEHSSQPLPSSWGLTSIEKQIIRQETMDNVMPWMEALITRTLEDIAAARSQSKNIALIGQVDQFIESHLTDPNLSATMLADHLGLSVNYFRSLYKAETTQSITDKISEKRLTFICQEAHCLRLADRAHRAAFRLLVPEHLLFQLQKGVRHDPGPVPQEVPGGGWRGEGVRQVKPIHSYICAQRSDKD